jgi:hypothetical protein
MKFAGETSLGGLMYISSFKKKDTGGQSVLPPKYMRL